MSEVGWSVKERVAHLSEDDLLDHAGRMDGRDYANAADFLRRGELRTAIAYLRTAAHSPTYNLAAAMFYAFVVQRIEVPEPQGKGE